MSSRLNRMWLMPFLLLASQAWALGLGEIRLSSALNQPMRAEIELLAATPEELENLSIALASEETFARYDLDRPLFLTRLQFEIVRSGSANGNFIRVSSAEPITEPFVTFLVEASWSRGRLLREYTILLDPPTFAPPPAAQSTQAVTAPARATPTDSGQIQRQPAPQPQAAPAPSRPSVQAPVQSQPTQPAPQPATQPAPQPATPTQGQPSFDSSPGGDLLVVRGDTLWGITNRVRPDSRLTINQTMLAIYEANPEAFAGNINVLRAGATLRIPSADDVFRISRGEAFAEVQRQNEAWGGGAPSGLADITPPPEQPSLTLVPPDEEDALDLSDDFVDPGVADLIDDTLDDVIVDPIDARISEIENILTDQDSLIEIPDNELAALRAELAELRGEEPPVEDTVDDELLSEDDEVIADDEVLVDDEVVAETPVPQVVTTTTTGDEGILDKIKGFASNFWVWVGGALILTVLILVWFMRRAANRDDEDATGVWEALDVDEPEPGSMASTERLKALARDDNESIVVVETEQQPEDDELFGMDTMETPAIGEPQQSAPAPAVSPVDHTGTNKALEDTFSSETAINLDQSDPVAEADFHMAYGLYDQAADLINGALAADPDRQDLLSKLCEIYFVWGNRDAFIDAAGRLKSAVGGGANPDWDKTVIMGQQIASDHEMFSGVSAEGATKAVDLSFDDGADDSSELDIDFAGAPEGDGADVIDLGGDSDDVIDLGGAAADGVSLTDTGQVSISPDMGTAIDFSVDEPDIEASITREMPGQADDTSGFDETSEMPAADLLDDDATAATAETPTIEQQFQMEATGELPAMSEEADIGVPEADATAEINLDDLGLDIGDLEETAVATDIGPEDAVSDLEDTAESQTLKIDDLEVTGTNEAVDELESTGRNPSLLDDDATQLASLDDDDADIGEDTDVGIDASLLDATGRTQILTEDMAVSTASDLDADIADNDATMLAAGYGDDDTIEAIPDDAATMLASLDDDDEDGEFAFAKTEALPKDVFSPDMTTDETGRMPGLAGSTDMDLDLDDLTAALKVSEVGDTVNQMRDDATVEQPRINPADVAGGDDTSSTQALAPEDLSGDLHDARTMTEVGTKLDLARAYVDMGDPAGAKSILEEVLDEGDQGQKQQAQQLMDSLPS